MKDGWWGYKLMVILDPHGNELYFNYPNAPDAPKHRRLADIAN